MELLVGDVCKEAKPREVVACRSSGRARGGGLRCGGCGGCGGSCVGRRARGARRAALLLHETRAAAAAAGTVSIGKVCQHGTERRVCIVEWRVLSCCLLLGRFELGAGRAWRGARRARGRGAGGAAARPGM